ncbi:tumor necrosis factor receptor superfamily member 6 [Phyllobates terribilis]|uniref:tumor necrosis factor receptor superfamily member 6 n=1 Tax=Phyllobates terribilis TaxID=111132 RepID=UPI003CCAE84C
MKFWSGVNRLALILILVVLVENNNHSTTDRGIKKKVDNSILHKLRKRENRCPDGEYWAVNHCCKLCNAGSYAESDCKQEHGDPTCNDCIEGSTYMDIKNGEHSCRKCTACDSVLEELSACTVTRNFVCKCKEHFFCAENITAESAGCTHCQHCTKCEHSYAERCSSIKDAVCYFPRQRYYAITASVLLVVLILFICYFCRKMENPNTPICSRRPRFIFPDDLKDIDLSNHLWDFAESMDYTTVRQVVHRLGITEVQHDRIQHEHQNDNQEQKFQLLKTWYEGHGMYGAFQDLIQKLQEAGKQRTAEKLIEIARAQRQQSQA